MGEISDALARAREKADATRDEALAKQTTGAGAPKARTRVPAISPSAVGLITPRPDRNGALDRDKPLTLAQLREETATEEKSSKRTRKTRAPRRPVHNIPRIPEEGWISRLCAVYPESPAAVRFRHLAVRVRGLLDDLPLKSLLITSAVAGEGKTTVSVNTAMALASIAPECRIALVDLDLRRGRVGDVFQYTSDVGIEHVLSGEVDLEDACVETDVPALDFYPIGRSIPDAHRLLGGSAARVLHELHARYDYLICDGPPVLPVPDIPLLAPQLGGCLAVVASGRSKHAQFRELLELVPRKSMLGVFMNESPGATGDGKYKYYDPKDSVKTPKEKSSGKASQRAESANSASLAEGQAGKKKSSKKNSKSTKKKAAGGESV